MKDWERILGSVKGKPIKVKTSIPQIPTKPEVSPNKKFRLSALYGEEVLKHEEGNFHEMPNAPQKKIVSKGDKALRSILGE